MMAVSTTASVNACDVWALKLSSSGQWVPDEEESSSEVSDNLFCDALLIGRRYTVRTYAQP